MAGALGHELGANRVEPVAELGTDAVDPVTERRHLGREVTDARVRGPDQRGERCPEQADEGPERRHAQLPGNKAALRAVDLMALSIGQARVTYRARSRR